ncbi:hypothetical protein [Desulfonatronovibrio hydrogenovorans]|uniref:hypothetical protein n=1 Tax=Desulfonatronovibrio hydrogenovorans TaxID=53245 RepID=UPI0012378270|nr:hypothetical protein [Desulfonatronovibrio hydrogenovorans]
MDRSEQMVFEYLSHHGFREVIYEPDGNIPPDFLIDGRIAVEVRRLNQNEDTPNGHRGLENVAIPLHAKVRTLLRTLGPSDGVSWYVMYRFRRPLPPWDQLAFTLRAELIEFRKNNNCGKTKRTVSPKFIISLIKAGRLYPDFFVPGGFVDGDSGGFVLSELNRNIRICVTEKTRKVAFVREKYPEWWLVLVDNIGHGIDERDHDDVRQLFHFEHSWNKIVLVNPLDTKQGYVL